MADAPERLLINEMEWKLLGARPKELNNLSIEWAEYIRADRVPIIPEPRPLTQEQYHGLMDLIDGWMDAAQGSAEEILLAYAVELVDGYEDENYPIEDDD